MGSTESRIRSPRLGSPQGQACLQDTKLQGFLAALSIFNFSIQLINHISFLWSLTVPGGGYLTATLTLLLIGRLLTVQEGGGSIESLTFWLWTDFLIFRPGGGG